MQQIKVSTQKKRRQRRTYFQHSIMTFSIAKVTVPNLSIENYMTTASHAYRELHGNTQFNRIIYNSKFKDLLMTFKRHFWQTLVALKVWKSIENSRITIRYKGIALLSYKYRSRWWFLRSAWSKVTRHVHTNTSSRMQWKCSIQYVFSSLIPGMYAQGIGK